MDRWRRGWLICAFLATLASLILVSMAASTPIWVSAEYSLSGQYSCALNLSCTGEVKLGLWYGSKVLDTGLGTKGRETDLQMYAYSTHASETYALWTSCLILISIAVLSGVVSLLLTSLNIGLVPIETQNGPVAIIIWNAISGGCVLISTVLLLVNFFVFIPEILLSRDEKEQGWKLENIYPTATLFYLPASLLSSFMAITATKQCATPTWICQVGYRSHTKDMLPNDPILLF